MEDIRGAVDRADSSLRDLLNLILNVSKETSSMEKAQPSSMEVEKNELATSTSTLVATSQGSVVKLAEGKVTTKDDAEATAGAEDVGDQEKRLVDSLLLNCKRLENYFASLQTDSSKVSVKREIEMLEKELQEKDLLIESVTADLAKWAQ